MDLFLPIPPSRDPLHTRRYARIRRRGKVDQLYNLVPNLPRVRIGSDGACDLVLPDLAPCAAVVFELGGRLVLREAPAQPRDVPTQLEAGDRYIDDAFSVGDYVIELRARAATPTDEFDESTFVVEAERAGRRWSWTIQHGVLDAGLAIGSDPRCPIALPELDPVAAIVHVGRRPNWWLHLAPCGTRPPVLRCDPGWEKQPVYTPAFTLGGYELRFVGAKQRAP